MFAGVLGSKRPPGENHRWKSSAVDATDYRNTTPHNPDLKNIQPLLDNTGLGAGDFVELGSTNVSCTDVAALKAKGVDVSSGCP